MRRRGDILVVSCYELGRPPLSAATVVAALRSAGFDPVGVDLAVETTARLDEAAGDAQLALIAVPMHAALRLGVRAAERVRVAAPDAHVTLFGLYAALNATWLLEGPADSITAGTRDSTLVDVARALERGGAIEALDGIEGLARRGRRSLPQPASVRPERNVGRVPARDAFPPLERYARLEHGDRSVPAAAVETTRGCRHHCRHCPIPPVWGGRFVAMPHDDVLADIDRVVADGAGHVSFADPDFLNGPTHARRVAAALHARHPGVTFDFTTKIEHLLRHRAMLPELAAAGCLFVISAVESLSATVLDRLDKGHDRDDVDRALAITRAAGIVLRPTFVPFTPWTTRADMVDLVEWVAREGLVQHVDPVQWSIRLLVPPGSLLEDDPAMRPHLVTLDRARFTWRWRHPDPAIDELQRRIERIVREDARRESATAATFARIRAVVAGEDGPPVTIVPPARMLAPPPRITEPWFC